MSTKNICSTSCVVHFCPRNPSSNPDAIIWFTPRFTHFRSLGPRNQQPSHACFSSASRRNLYRSSKSSVPIFFERFRQRKLFRKDNVVGTTSDGPRMGRASGAVAESLSASSSAPPPSSAAAGASGASVWQARHLSRLDPPLQLVGGPRPALGQPLRPLHRLALRVRGCLGVGG